MGASEPGECEREVAILSGVRQAVGATFVSLGVAPEEFSFAVLTDAHLGDVSSDVILHQVRRLGIPIATIEEALRDQLGSMGLEQYVTLERGFINVRFPSYEGFTLWGRELARGLPDNPLSRAMGPWYCGTRQLTGWIADPRDVLSPWGKVRLASLAFVHAGLAQRLGFSVRLGGERGEISTTSASPLFERDSVSGGQGAEVFGAIVSQLHAAATSPLCSAEDFFASSKGALSRDSLAVAWLPGGADRSRKPFEGSSVSGGTAAAEGPLREPWLGRDLQTQGWTVPFVPRRWLDGRRRKRGAHGSAGAPAFDSAMLHEPDVGNDYPGKAAIALAWYLCRDCEVEALDPYVALFNESENLPWFAAEVRAELQKLLSADWEREGAREAWFLDDTFTRIRRESALLPWSMRYGVLAADPCSVVRAVRQLLDLTCHWLASHSFAGWHQILGEGAPLAADASEGGESSGNMKSVVAHQGVSVLRVLEEQLDYIFG